MIQKIQQNYSMKKIIHTLSIKLKSLTLTTFISPVSKPQAKYLLSDIENVMKALASSSSGNQT